MRAYHSLIVSLSALTLAMSSVAGATTHKLAAFNSVQVRVYTG